MNSAIIAFLAGITLVQHWIRLPAVTEYFTIVVLALLFGHWRWRLGCVFLLASLWASIYAEWRLADRLADDREGKEVMIQGYIASLPKRQEHRMSFDFIVTRAPRGIPTKLRLNWYAARVSIKGGQSWQMTVKLKKPHGRINPGGFDYEGWLFANHIGATGYVRPNPKPTEIEAVFAGQRYLAKWRQMLSDQLDRAMPQSAWAGVLKALILGSRGEIGREQWELFRKSGTVHLMVISGTHISLIAGLVFFVVRRFSAYTGLLSISPQNAAALSAWVVALFYVALAGFSIPTQRALIMLSVGLWATAWQRDIAALQVLLIALLAVLLFDPSAVLSAGFWLSFAAVALLMFVTSGRLGRASYWRESGKLHIAMAIGLAPLLIAFFQQISIVSPLANWVAVPVVALLLTPLALLAAILVMWSPALASFVLFPVDKILQYLTWLLQKMVSWPWAALSCPPPPWYGLYFAIIGSLLLLAPKGMPGRYLCPFFLLPLFFGVAAKPKAGEVWLTLLDVGQGLSAVVQTQNHVLIYDTGAKYSDQSDMGEAVILPFLRYKGINTVDRLVISHGENDHSGGAASLIAGISLATLYSSAADWAERSNGHYCKAGQSWFWDGVRFDILSPGIEAFASKNNNSCVLKLSAPQHGLLLSGDIEREAERWLVEYYGEKLASTVLIAPHHGSKTSSHRYFLDSVDPKLILIPAGYRNRFGFPHRPVLQRYRKRHIVSLISGEQGAITVKMTRSTLTVESWRQRNKHYWTHGD